MVFVNPLSSLDSLTITRISFSTFISPQSCRMKIFVLVGNLFVGVSSSMSSALSRILAESATLKLTPIEQSETEINKTSKISDEIERMYGEAVRAEFFESIILSGDRVSGETEFGIELPKKSAMLTIMKIFETYFKNRKIVNPSKILTFSFKRIKADGSRHSTQLYYPEWIDLSRQAGGGEGTYRLLGVLHNMGDNEYAAQIFHPSRIVLENGSVKDVPVSDTTSVALIYERADFIPITTTELPTSRRLSKMIPPYTTTNSPSAVPGLRGIVNLGNTCYLNAVLQVLSHSTRFRRMMASLTPFPETGLDVEYKRIVNSLARYMAAQWAPPSAVDRVINPRDLVLALRSMVDGSQEDSQKASSAILNALTGLGIGEGVLVSVLRTTSRCTVCSSEKAKHELTTSISVPMSPTLQESIRTFLAEENINEVDCVECTGRRDTHYSYRFTPAPLLLINLKRLGIEGKLPTFIRFPPEFTATEYFPGSSGQYRLVGVVHHLGSEKAGHYAAEFLNSEDNTWYFADDSLIASHRQAFNGISVTALLYEQLV